MLDRIESNSWDINFYSKTTVIRVNKLKNVWSTCHSIHQQYSIGMLKAIMRSIYVLALVFVKIDDMNRA